MKLYISTDFEGVSGVVAWEQALEGQPDYGLGRELLLGETNAAIEGALAAGVTEVVVNDAHNVMRNLDPSRLAGRAAYVSGRFKPLYMMEGLDDSFDAVFLLGYHGSAGTASVLSHTYNPRAISEVRLNGEVTGEAGVNVLVAQALGVPVVLITGDRLTGEEARRFVPGIRVAIVKDSVSRFGAVNLHPDTARDIIRDAAKEAVEAAADADSHPIPTPARLDIRFLTEDMAVMAAWIDGVERTAPRAVALEDSDTLSLYRRFVAVVFLTRALAE